MSGSNNKMTNICGRYYYRVKNRCKYCNRYIMFGFHENQKYCNKMCRLYSNRKWYYNFNYFNKIDKPEKAYWIGFILGDGHIYNKTVNIGIIDSDIKLLYNLIDEINGNYEQVRKINCERLVRLDLNNTQIVQDLINLGIPAKNKSYTAKPLDIPFINAFYLGLFDADGSVGVYNDKVNYKKKIYKYKSFYLQLAGTKEICEGFRDFLGYKTKYIYKRCNYYQFKLRNKNTCLNTYKKLYKYNIPCLERKKNIFKRWMDGK